MGLLFQLGAKITVEKVSTFFNLYLTRYVKEREVNERYAAAEQKAREEGKEMPKKTEAEKVCKLLF